MVRQLSLVDEVNAINAEANAEREKREAARVEAERLAAEQYVMELEAYQVCALSRALGQSRERDTETHREMSAIMAIKPMF